MTAHEYDKCKHFGIHIPDDPTEADVLAVLAALCIGTKVEWDTSNRLEIERLRGTPGEPVPIKRSTFVTCLRWVDGFVPRHWRHRRSMPEVIIYQTVLQFFRS